MKYNLKNGKKLTVTSICCEGMAGEPMEMVILKIGRKIVRLDDCKKLLAKNDLKELKDYMYQTGAHNYYSAVSYVI